jgi:hypothetical protein
VSQFLLWIDVTLIVLVSFGLFRFTTGLAEIRKRLDLLSDDQARALSRLELLERQLNEYWRGVEMRVGMIHDTFESGRACRMGTTIVDVDVKMGHLNRKMEEILERMPRPGRGEEPS